VAERGDEFLVQDRPVEQERAAGQLETQVAAVLRVDSAVRVDADRLAMVADPPVTIAWNVGPSLLML
jgi:hypothetical protein